MLKKWLTSWVFIAAAATSALILLVFRTLLFNLQTNLLDRFDFPYYTWVLHHALVFLQSPTQAPFFSTNAYFPATDTYFFSDLLLPQALLGLIPTWLGLNPIGVTNTIVILTLLLNAAAAAWFWSTKFKTSLPLLFATITTALSPFLFTQLGHLQMLTLWPLLITLGLLTRTKEPSVRLGIGVAGLWIIQLLASFYLSIFLLGCLGWYLLHTLISYRQWRACLWFGLSFAVAAALLGGPILYQYYQVKQTYNIKTSIQEYITFAAHPTDYLFIPYTTLVSRLANRWQQLNYHQVGEGASYPGTASLLLGLIGLFGLKKSKGKLSLSISTQPRSTFFLGLMVIGVVFSLGPRLSFNGSYVHLPLPYWLVLKLFPFLETVRATARWSLLFYLGLTYFAAQTLDRMKNSRTQLAAFSVALVWFLLEMVPWQLSSITVTAALESSHPITQACQTERVLAIFPFTEQHLTASLTTNLARKTTELLRSTIHHCTLVNGYGGFEPPAYQALEKQLNQALFDDKVGQFWQILVSQNVELVYLDTTVLSPQMKATVDSYFAHYALADMAEPPVNVVAEQPNSWYLVELNRYDTVIPSAYGE
jgi:hypothetical protein